MNWSSLMLACNDLLSLCQGNELFTDHFTDCNDTIQRRALSIHITCEAIKIESGSMSAATKQ